DNIDHHILIKLLKRKIKDEKFINLIWKFLRAGYLEDWKFNNTYSGTPQGGIISPILSNIYLNELDKYIEEYKTLFDKGTRR
ncbi:reverse transcriptase/maturase family protein, partial [Bacillus thuringiensis]